jgi:hypothetical protein
MMERIRAHHCRELRIVERKLLDIGDLEPDVRGVARELLRALDHLGGEIDPDDDARSFRGRPGCSAGAAADIENAVIPIEFERAQRRVLHRVAPA